MKKFFEKLKNAGNIIKVVLFVSDLIKVVVDCYKKHFPQDEEETTIESEMKERKGNKNGNGCNN